MSLDEIGIRFVTDKASIYPKKLQPTWGGIGHGYCEIYERYFNSRLKANARAVLELGVLGGASIRMWREYFDKAHIYGFDIRPWRGEKLERVTMLRGNQESRSDLSQIGQYAPFDVIIDDCGHSQRGQQISLGYLFKWVKPGGVYVMEDLFTSHAGDTRHYPMLPGQTTLRIMTQLAKGEPFTSPFMLDDEVRYIMEQTASVKIENGNRSEIAFIWKKKCDS